MPVKTATPFPLDGPIPAFYADLIDPFVGLARVSAVTKTIKLGTGICLAPDSIQVVAFFALLIPQGYRLWRRRGRTRFS